MIIFKETTKKEFSFTFLKTWKKELVELKKQQMCLKTYLIYSIVREFFLPIFLVILLLYFDNIPTENNWFLIVILGITYIIIHLIQVSLIIIFLLKIKDKKERVKKLVFFFNIIIIWNSCFSNFIWFICLKLNIWCKK